jgi:hypothetical protein
MNTKFFPQNRASRIARARKTFWNFSIREIFRLPIFARCQVVGLVIFIAASGVTSICRAQQPDGDIQGAEVLTRGPVHEAFAGIVTFNAEPGVVVANAPPDLIEELPPEERPEGDNVTWIPGYWAWDDERNDFLWISGTWRALPPGREWMAGYWGQTSHGHQWISGYWADATVQETTYLPPPPVTVEAGPNIEAPSIDYGWTPGCWVWYQGRYAWSPGYWVQGRAEWDWIPAHYVWTPRGYIFVGGYWDYPVERRGVLFAPVYFESDVYSRRDYHYSPTIVINLAIFNEHLFLRPRYHHYYFGDYYAENYHQGGFYASFSFSSSRRGYDPIYSRQRWANRSDREWNRRVETSYQYRRDHEDARPPRTWAAQRNINPATAESKENRFLVATPIDQMAKRKDNPLRFQRVAKEERQKLAQRGQEVKKSRDQRRTVEANVSDSVARKSNGVSEPATVQLPRSPIVAKPANRLGKNQAPPPAPRALQPDLKIQPKSVKPGAPPSGERSKPQSALREPELEKKITPYQAVPREGQVQPEPERRTRELQNQTPEEARRSQSAPRKSESEKKTTPYRNETVPRERQVQPEAERRTRELQNQTPEEARRKTKELENRGQPQSQQRTKEAAVKTSKDSQRNVNAGEKKTQPVPEQTVQPTPTPGGRRGTTP